MAMEQRYRDAGRADADQALRVLQAYAALTGTIGDLRTAVESTRRMMDSDPAFAATPRARNGRRKMEAQWAAVLERAGIRSERELDDLLRRGIRFAEGLLARPGLDNSTRAAAHLARARMLFQARRFDEAMRDADASLRTDATGVLAHFVKADVYTERRNYEAATRELRAASLKLNAWAAKPPPWELRIAWALRHPDRAFLYERDWRARRQEIVRSLHVQIQSEVSVLQGLERTRRRAP